MPIHVLSEQLAAQIAAGEVIERPASVVKELMENALDAGATEVHVDVRDGGKRLIRVADNGCGIPSAELELAFVHHATSKLQSVDDLFAIQTLGFRGEALPSIAAVANVTFLTRAADEAVGTELTIAAGRVTGKTPHASPQGTRISVDNLFYNIPARLKFMKSNGTESGHIHDLLNRYALAYPNVRFSLTSEGRLAFQSTGNGAMADVLVAVYGSDTASQMFAVDFNSFDASRQPDEQSQDGGGRTPYIQVVGYVSSATLSRANRSHMTLFVNGRAVQDRNLLFAVNDAYHTILPVGRFPVCILKVSLPAERVDVNVHPTKAEVRFRDPHLVFNAVQRAVRQTLLANQVVPAIGAGADAWPHISRADRFVTSGYRPPEAHSQAPEQLALHRQHSGEHAAENPGWSSVTGVSLPPPIASLHPPAEQTDTAAQQPSPAAMPAQDMPLPMLRVLGQVARMYIVAEGPQGIFLIDQHAAHERVLYEKFVAERSATEHGNAQPLLEPLAVELSAQQAARLNDAASLFRDAGFEFEHFGGATYLLRAVPTILSEGDPRRALSIILDELALEDERPAEGGRSLLHGRRDANLIASVCKQAAIKAGRLLTLAEMQALIEQLERSQSPRTCPHGRPTMIRLGFEQLAREFGRQ